MEFQDQASNVIERISQELDPLFYRCDVRIKFRKSDPSVVTEHLTYEKEGIRFKITAHCHPLDYPYSVALQLIDTNQSPWKYINHEEIIDMGQKISAIPKSDLLIATEAQIQTTIEALHEIAKCILNNKF